MTRAGRFAEAEARLAELDTAARNRNNSIAHVDALNAHGSLLLARARADAGAARYAQALALADRMKVDTVTRIALLLDQCAGYASATQYDSLLHLAYAVRGLARATHDTLAELTAELDIGLVHANTARDYAVAMDHTTRAAVLARAMGIERHRLLAEHRLAYIGWDILNDQEVHARWTRTLQEAELGGFDQIAVQSGIGLGMFLMSRDSLRLSAWGVPYAVRFDTARALIAMATDRAERLGSEELLNDCLSAAASVENYAGDPRASIRIQEHQLALARAGGRVRQQVNAYQGIGSNLIQLQEWRKAIAMLDSGSVLARAHGMLQSMNTLLYRLFYCHERLGDHATALNYVLQRDTLRDRIGGVDMAARMGEQLARHAAQLDSLAHVQQLALERAEAQARIDRQRTRTVAALGGGAVLLMGGAVAFAMDRRRRQARFAQQAAELEREAARFETQALRSQMNPHFIFNALNSIAGYVQGNDPDRAQSFLARFAKLMRAVLENSRFAEVPLARDLEVLRAYMELERVRAQGKFSYTIAVAPDLDAEAVLVPPLLAQPFVENAIWHGVAGKQGDGHIAVHVEQADGQLRIRVEDDGVGRAQQRSAVSKEKTSLGTAITRSRLDLVEKQKGAPAGFRYVEVPVGTRVEIHLPLEMAA
ncbi:MAG TPA: histidine kinase [Flavobacteriales bacterium]|nr:histidine kinase [Flavobacteriales bacterium]